METVGFGSEVFERCVFSFLALNLLECINDRTFPFLASNHPCDSV